MSKRILELKLEQMAFGGEALATHEGMKIFVPWGVPGDRVKAEVVEEKKDFARARVIEVLEASPHRQKAACPYFFKCGGCQWQHIRYESQLLFKQDLLQSALQRVGKMNKPELLEPIPAFSPLHYRNKIRMQVSKQGKLGFYKIHSKEVVEIENCLIAQDSLNAALPKARALGQQLFLKDKNKIHEIEILQTGEQGKGEEVKVKVTDDAVFFAQANSTQNEILKLRVLEYLKLSGKENLLELFAGDGNFTFEIAKKSGTVVAVESNSQAILSAEEKIRKGHCKNIEFVESSAHRYLQNPTNLPLTKGGKRGFDRILLDPPRMGMEQGIENLAQLKAPIIIYVSCDPATLARDVKELIHLGYTHEFSQVIDMFPQTHHIESMTCLKLV